VGWENIRAKALDNAKSAQVTPTKQARGQGRANLAGLALQRLGVAQQTMTTLKTANQVGLRDHHTAYVLHSWHNVMKFISSN
jgi:hypothetical protein